MLFCGLVHLDGVCRLHASHPHGDGVHPYGCGTECGVRVILATFKFQVPAVEIAFLANVFDDEVVDAGVVFPVGWADPHEGYGVDDGDDFLDVFLTFGKVAHEEFVATQA